MINPYSESKLLREMWHHFNEKCFDERLTEPSSIGWLDFTNDPDIKESYGYYFRRTNDIVLSHRFQCVEDQAIALDELVSNPAASQQEKEEAISKSHMFEIVGRILVHEMIHQASYQAGEIHENHDMTFIKHAMGVANYFGITPPDLSNAHRWPNLVE